MDDIQSELSALSRLGSQVGGAYPRVYCKPHEVARFDVHRAQYAVFWRTGNGSWSAIYRGPDRRRALETFRKFPKGAAYVEMRDALTDELIGERGRYEFDSEISELLAQAARCTDDERTTQRVTTRGGARSIKTGRRELLLKRAAALYMCCHLPGGD
jgi:hypothetical protein